MELEAAARGARAQSMFRVGNERLLHINEAFSSVLTLGEWVCECADIACTQRVEVTTVEYEAVRGNPRRFVVAPGEHHVFHEIERLVDRHDRFWVVEKTGPAGDLAASVDPRAEDVGGRMRLAT